MTTTNIITKSLVAWVLMHASWTKFFQRHFFMNCFITPKHGKYDYIYDECHSLKPHI